MLHGHQAVPLCGLMISPDLDRLWTRRFLWLAGGLLLVRLIYMAMVPLELSGDEAYYWDWGRRPDWCYFSKPPLVGWLMALIRMTFGYHWEAVRLVSALLATGTLTMMFLLGRTLFGARAGFFAALLLMLTPAFSLLSIALINDAPLMLCWSASLWLFWRAAQKPSAARWLALCLVIGIGVLAKQMMLVFPVMMVLFASLQKDFRHLLRRPGFWLCIFGAVLFMTPVVLWNIEHDWITAKHTAEHFQSEDGTHLAGAVQFPFIQAAMYSVITWVLVIATLIRSIRNWPSLDSRVRYLVLFSAPGLLFVTVMVLRQHVNENWPAVYYVAAFVLAGGLASMTWIKRALWLGGVMTVALHVVVPLADKLGIPADKLGDMRGWPESGQKIGDYLSKVPRPEQTFIYVLGHRHAASQLAFHLPEHPRLYRWNRHSHPESQYEIWPSAVDKIGWDAFIVEPLTGESKSAERPLEFFVRRNFESVEPLGQVLIPLGGDAVRRFNLFLGRNMLRYPDSVEAQIAADPKLQRRYGDKPTATEP